MTNDTKSFCQKDREMMATALDEARTATAHQDVPVGAVLVDNCTGAVIATAHNTREKEGSALGHAEISAIQTACKALGTWRLSNCTLYVTLEPCPMCAGAIMGARIPRVVCGAKDAVAGAMGSVWSLHTHPVAQTHTQIQFGCMEEEAKDLLRLFFAERRKEEHQDI